MDLKVKLLCRALLAFIIAVSGCVATKETRFDDACTATDGGQHCGLQLVHVRVEKVAAAVPPKRAGFKGAAKKKYGSMHFVGHGRHGHYATWYPWNRSKGDADVFLDRASLHHQEVGTAQADTAACAAGIIALAFEECAPSNLSYWKSKSEKMAKFLSTWQERRPHGSIQIDGGEEACMHSISGNHASNISVSIDDHGTAGLLATARRVSQKLQILNVVHQSPPDICMSEKETQDKGNFYDVPQHLFNISGALLELGPMRSYGIVWPGRFVCLQARCPLVLSLHGAGEHAIYARNYYDFQLMGNTGLMRSVQKDPECVRSLRSVMIFPQLLEAESWVRDGPQLVEFFLVPLLRNVVHRHDDMVDPSRVAIIGYSEGAFGALQAATRYPHVFSFACAIAASLDALGWKKVPLMTAEEVAARPRRGDWRLQALVIAMGERDESGDQSVNLRNSLDIVEDAGMTDEVPLMVRMYAGLGHNHWVNVFNRWPAFHDVVWKGQFGKIFAGEGARDELAPQVPSQVAPGVRISQMPSVLDDHARRSPRNWWV